MLKMVFRSTIKHDRWGFESDSDAPEDWRQVAACRGADPTLFEGANSDTHPKLRFDQRHALTESRFAVAIRYCERCPVRSECQESASPKDRAYTIRGGILPWDQEEVPDTIVERVSPSPRGRPRTDFTGLQEAVQRFLLEGRTVEEMATMLDYGKTRITVAKRMVLEAWTSGKPDAVIDFKVRHGYGSKLNGPAWEIARSACGTMKLVATRREGRLAVWILRSTWVESTRSDVLELKGSAGSFPQRV